MRLIDADVFEVVTLQDKSEEFCNGVQWILEQIDKQPTINRVVLDEFSEGCNDFLPQCIEVERKKSYNQALDDFAKSMKDKIYEEDLYFAYSDVDEIADKLRK